MNHFQVTLFSVTLVILILLAAFFSLAETSLMAVNRYRLRHQARMKKRYALRLLQLLKRPDRLLGAILIGNTFANMLASSLATLLAFHFWGDEGAVLTAIVLTLVVLIFAEITPKTWAAIYPDQIARFVVYPIQIVLRLLYPLVWFANIIANGLLKLMHVRVSHYSVESLSREELRSVVFDAAGKMSRQYQNMLLAILDLNKLKVDDVMIPRHEIAGIDIEQPYEEIVFNLKHFHQDWVPFYRESMNQIVGVLYMHDALHAFLAEKALNKELLQQILEEPYFVPEGTSLTIQLDHFQKQHDKVAFVVNEYGELQGLLTVNDILEEIVGDFKSTLTLAKYVQPEADGSYLVDGATTVREFNRTSQWHLPLRGPRTINGLIVEYLEALPHAGTTVLIAGYPIEIIEVKEKRVKLARIFPKLLSK